jgi:tRNA A37 N6-isopentenylltransferase MiaA
MGREAYLLAGATATGKSDAAAILARELGAAILSADSMLVYRGMDIGTAKPSPEERAEFDMGGVDLVTPAEDFSAGEWLRQAGAWAAKLSPARPIVVVGGTGLYFTALLRGLDAPWQQPPPEYPVLQMDRDERRVRIGRRIDAMLSAGLEHEVAHLRAVYPIWSRTAAAAIGYKEFGAPLRGTDEAVSSFRPVSGRSVRDEIFYRTCQFAKRQDTWFRHQSTPLYVPCGATAEETAAAVRTVWQAHGPWSIDLPTGSQEFDIITA